MTLGRKVKAKRLKFDLSLRELAQEVGISYATISRLERDECSPDDLTIHKINNWLHNKNEIAMPKELAPILYRLEAKLDRIIKHAS